jgi:uncharacterized protein (TIGR02266 family)
MTERRKGPRVDVLLRAYFDTMEQLKEALVCSLSPGGLYLTTDKPFDIGSQFFVEIHLPGDGGLIKGQCEVTWVNLSEEKSYPKGMGVSFIEIAPEHRDRLQFYLANISDG